MQRDRAIHGMRLGLPSAAFFQQIRLKGEIPFGGPVRIVDEHEAGIVFQALGLADHRFLILAQKCFGESAENEYGKGNIPRCHKINPAKIPPHRRDGRAAGKPEFAVRMFGKTKSIVVVTGAPVIFFNI